MDECKIKKKIMYDKWTCYTYDTNKCYDVYKIYTVAVQDYMVNLAIL